MARQWCYADAVRLLGGRDDKTVAALDRVTDGLLLAASAAGAGFALSLFDPASQLVRLSVELVSALRERVSGLSRFSRSERLAAAHAVIVLAAYFECLKEMSLPFDTAELGLTRAGQVGLATGDAAGASRAGELAAALLRAEVPMPAPQCPYEVTLRALRGFYGRLSEAVERFTAGLAVWEGLDDTRRQRFCDALGGDLPDRAMARYEELFRQLAATFPELAFWANAVDHQATRQEIQRLNICLAGIGEVLAGVAAGQVPDERRHALARTYQAALARPVLGLQDVPDGLRLPLLGEAYVNPSFRVVQVDAADRLARESWWQEHPVRDDLQGFLVAHLTAPQATEAPLLVLGQPGSGKSLLTQVLAAQLPPGGFLAVRVILREVPADADVQAQIEYAIRAATGESLGWPQLARSAGGALPVILLDGFDELLQATGVSQSDYLEKAAEFQRREADLGRPAAVLVTSRTTVADRARAVPGTVAVRLEPFQESQVAQWLKSWNTVNAASVAARGLRPLTAEIALAQGELASQPLLLLMLALYDADANALHGHSGPLGHAELYERLLRGFAEREIRKSSTALPASQFSQAVDREMMRLSIAAFAMFNRGRQWVTTAELDADLPALLGSPETGRHATTGMRAELTASEIVIGRFFFIHEAHAVRDDVHLKTYEFLHATFAEYLIARLLTQELGDLTDAAELSVTRTRAAPVDDLFLHALLSFTALTTRAPALSFLAEQLGKLTRQRRILLRDLLLAVFRDALHARHDGAFTAYQPAPVTVPARHAAYSANLALLIVLVNGDITSQQLFPGSADPVEDWRRLAFLWRSQLAGEGWSELVHTLEVRRLWDGAQRVICVQLDPAEALTPTIDPYWSYDRRPGSEYRGGLSRWRNFSYEDLRRHNYFMCDAADDTIMHTAEPFANHLDPTVGTIHGFWQDRATSAANALIRLWITASRQSTSEELLTACDTCLLIALDGFFTTESLDITAQQQYSELVFRQLAAHWNQLPSRWLDSALRRISAAGTRDPAISRLAREILPEYPRGAGTRNEGLA
jgi:hypothetical protein